MAGKDCDVTTFRKDDSAKLAFETLYYTADIHTGALTLPPFMKKAIS